MILTDQQTDRHECFVLTSTLSLSQTMPTICRLAGAATRCRRLGCISPSSLSDKESWLVSQPNLDTGTGVLGGHRFRRRMPLSLSLSVCSFAVWL